MRKSAAAAEFGRLFLRMAEQRSLGEWVRSQSIYDAVLAAHPDNAYVDYLLNGPGARRAKVPYVIQDVMPEFPHVERRKDGAWHSAPVWYRTVGYRLVQDPVASGRGFADWRAALEAGSTPFLMDVRILAEHGMFMSVVPGEPEQAGINVYLADQFPAPPWVVQINEPSEPGKENGLSALALDARGRRVLLRQGRLQRNALSGLIVGEEFRLGTGRMPVSVALPAGGATREWFVVADVDSDPYIIREQTSAFVAACAAARRISSIGWAGADEDRLFAGDEQDATYITAGREASPPEVIRKLQGRVWQALARLCAARGQRMRKPLHAWGYEVDVELPDAPDPLLIEIKTGRTAADVYVGVGQLTLYPRLIPWTRRHLRVLLLRGSPSPPLVAALEGSEILLHSYNIDQDSEEVVFSTDFLGVCGLA